MTGTSPGGGIEDLGAFQTGPPKAHLPAALQSLLALEASERRLGPFLLVEQLGRGGFAPVWLAREVYGEIELRSAAVKLFSLGTSGDGDQPTSAVLAARGRILDEARALCRVEHPNVVRFYALPIDEARGVAGLAMEHVAGTSLDRRLAARGRLSVLETLAVGIAIASALAAVHRKGIVHRDVKPANVVEAAGDYKLIDFGIAAADALVVRRAAGRLELGDLPPAALGSRASAAIQISSARERESARNAPTEHRALACGTLGYVDPACIAFGAPANEASDLYALGAMLFECLAGQVPAAAHAPEGVGFLGHVLDGRAPAPALLEVAPDAPAALGRLVDALLRPERRERPTSAEWVVIVLEQIQAELVGLSRALPPESIGPFRGLGRFRESDRGVFFGQSSEIAAALELLRGRGVLALVGPSGSGKSSLARAGVLPAVAEGALGGWPKQWDVFALEPGGDPRAAVAAALAPIVPDAGEREPEALISALAERARAAGRGVVLLVDQLEELATLEAGASCDWVVALLDGLASQALPGVRAVVTARRDRIEPLLARDGLGKALIQGSVLVEPLSALSWAAVLDQGLAAYGYSIEDEALRDEIADGIAEISSAMPLLQVALTELWDRRDTAAKKVTRAGLRAIGGLSGALSRHAEATLAELGEEVADAEPLAKGMLLSLTTPLGMRVVRSQEELDATGPRARVVLEAFERARLVVSSAEGLTLAYEALPAHWGRLRGWVEETRDERLLGEELERDAARWRVDPTLAPRWQRHRLAFAERLLRREPGPSSEPLSENAAAFVKAGRQAERRLRVVVIAAVCAALLGLTAGWAAYVRSGWAKGARSEEQAIRKELDELKHQAVDEDATRKEQAAREEGKKREEATRRQEAEKAASEGQRAETADSSSKPAVVEAQRPAREAGKGTGEKERKGGNGATGRAPAVAGPPSVLAGAPAGALASASITPSAAALPAPSSAPKPALTVEKSF